MNHEQIPARSILYLPIGQVDRVQLWLTYKEVKPASTILLPNPKKDIGGKQSKRILKWLRKAKLRYGHDKSNLRLLHISKDKKKVSTLNRLQWDNREDSVFRKGWLYGYPKESAKQFAKVWTGNDLRILMADDEEIDKALAGKYWKKYVVYSTRRGRVWEDSMVAKKWADAIRKDLPQLAQWYED